MRFQLQTEKILTTPTTGTTGKNVIKDHPFVKEEIICRYRFTRIVAEMISVDGEKCESEMCQILQHLLETLYTPRSSMEKPQNEYYSNKEFWTLDIGIGVALTPTSHDSANTLLNSYVQVKGVHPVNILGALSDFTDGEARVKVDYKLKDTNGKTILWEFSSTDLCIERKNEAICEDRTVKFPASVLSVWKETTGLYADFTISVTVPDESLPGNYKNHKNLTAAVGCQKILEEEILSDVTIVASDGSKIMAHKNFLSVHSSVFLAMFQSDMRESRESTVEIPDMCGESVRNFLKYVYYGNTSFVEEANSQIALELLYAGHKYDVSGLEEMMMAWILKKPTDWFDVDVGVRLFLFARNLTPEDEELKRKAIQVIKLNCGMLESSPSIQELFNKDAKAALALLMYAFTA